MKKESLSVMTAKTLLAVLLFAGIGTIIIGGGYIIGEYGKTQNNKNVTKEPLNEWRICNQDSDCVETQADCCGCSNGGEQIGINRKYLKSWEDALKDKCQDIGCITLFSCKEGGVVCEDNKCEFKTELETCTQNAALDFLDDKQGNDPCDRSCEFDSDCKLECGCECISKDEECEYTGIECEMPNPDYGCQCVNQKCKYNYIGTNADISNWQTYRNEEFEFEFQYFSKWKINVGKIIANEKGEQRQLISIDNLEMLSGDAEISLSIRENILLENILQAEKNLNCYNVISGNEQKNECSFCSVDESDVVVAGYNGKKITKISKEIKCKERGSCENLCIDYKVRTVIFQKDNNTYILNTTGGEQPLENFNQILSTFKFIEKDDTSDWQTYRNEEFGFEVEYPEDWFVYERSDQKRVYIQTTEGHVSKATMQSDFKRIWIGYAFDKLGERDEDYLKKYPGIKKYDMKNGEILMNIYEYEDIDMGEIMISAYWTKDNNNYLAQSASEVGQKNAKEQAVILKQILSTFKFIEK